MNGSVLSILTTPFLNNMKKYERLLYGLCLLTFCKISNTELSKMYCIVVNCCHTNTTKTKA